MTDSERPGHSEDVLAVSAARLHPEVAAPAAVDRPSFDEVYQLHFDFVWRSVCRLGVAERSADDAVQDVFIVVHRKLAEFEGRASIKTWLFAIARRVAHDHRRRAQRKDRAGELPESLADEHTRSPRDAAETSEAVRVLRELLATLPDEQREVFVLAELEQMTAPEIAEAVTANVNTVYSRLRLARAAFNKAVARRQSLGPGEPR